MRLLANVNLDFLGKRRFAGILSLGVIVLGLASLLVKGGPMLGIDFTGGTLAQLQLREPADLASMREQLLSVGFTRPILQQFGSPEEILVRVPSAEAGDDFTDRLRAALTETDFEIRRLETVGPKIGEELRSKAFQAVLFALFGILIYIALRFDRYYAVGAVAALTHDVLITLGIFSLLNLEIDLAIIAAFLTIVGYSLNDTIVVFDRVRENIKINRKTELFTTVNSSINETLSRTIITSLTTFAVVLVLYLIGGEVIKYFSFALIIGVIVGTYSSIYVACPIMAILETRAQARAAK
ncbi:MAG: protein translocase subunit SecF [Candidatus Marinimicrobia bacterium]|nr:protein translocase subunit SecF [Candidatus Neomarinimicrobiota bacterium]